MGELEEVIAKGMIEHREVDGRVAKQGAVVKGGDTILLRGGFHGRIQIRGGYNNSTITIAAEEGQKAGVSQVVIDGGSMWQVKGLHVSPSLAPKPPEKHVRHLVSLGEHGRDDSNRLEVRDCFIFSVPDASAWTAEDWVKRGVGVRRSAVQRVRQRLLESRSHIETPTVDPAGSEAGFGGGQPGGGQSCRFVSFRGGQVGEIAGQPGGG